MILVVHCQVLNNTLEPNRINALIFLRDTKNDFKSSWIKLRDHLRPKIEVLEYETYIKVIGFSLGLNNPEPARI